MLLFTGQRSRFEPAIAIIMDSRWRSARRSALAVWFGFTMVLLAACGVETTSPAAGTFTPRTPGILTVVTTDVPSPGFWEGTPGHVTGGFEFELAKALAQRLGLRGVRIKIERFHRIVQGQLDGADLSLDLITPTNERARSLMFSAPYLESAPTVVARVDTSVPDLATAQGLRWGAVGATTFVGTIAGRIRPDASTRVYDNTADMIRGLEDRQVDAVLLDLPAAVATAHRSGGRLHAAAQLPVPETIAAALPKGSSNEQAVSSAFRAFTDDGTINRLLRVWVGSEAANAERAIPLLETTL